MAHVDWMIRGPELATCNCAWGCPCQFNALPTHGDCRALGAIRIDEGHFGEVRLDGLKFVSLLAWPGPIHEGRGEVQLIVDERADANQRDAIIAIASGQETEPMATFFNVFASTMEKVHEPITAPIDFEIDVSSRTGRLSVPGIAEMEGEPIRNPMTGAPHRARVSIPDGFEFVEAEFGSSNVRTSHAIELAWSKGHAHFCMLHMNAYGPIRG